jgi:hypothetical protein
MDRQVEEVRREVGYLEKKGYIATKIREIGGRFFSTLHITADGIDVVEGRSEESSIHVGGDLFQVTVGNGARNVALGKDVTQLQSAGGPAPVEQLDSALQQFLIYLDGNGRDQIGNKECEVLRKKTAELRELLQETAFLR